MHLASYYPRKLIEVFFKSVYDNIWTFFSSKKYRNSNLFSRLIPSTISVSDDAGSEAEPVIPAPPPGYESQPGFSVVTDELLPPSSQHKKPDSSSNKKCSKNNDLESRL